MGVPEYGEIRQPGVTACTRIKKAAIRLSVKRGLQPVLTGRAYPQRRKAAIRLPVKRDYSIPAETLQEKGIDNIFFLNPAQ